MRCLHKIARFLIIPDETVSKKQKEKNQYIKKWGSTISMIYFYQDIGTSVRRTEEL
jgi:hypothetical protein